VADPVRDMGDLDRLLDQYPREACLLLTVDGVGKAGKREALRALVSELVRQNKTLSEKYERERARYASMAMLRDLDYDRANRAEAKVVALTEERRTLKGEAT
jgi:hypothetical protein